MEFKTYTLDDTGMARVGNSAADAIVNMAVKDGVISQETADVISKYRVVHSARKDRLFGFMYDWLWPKEDNLSCFAVVFMKETKPSKEPKTP
jgi:hypothetical protein